MGRPWIECDGEFVNGTSSMKKAVLMLTLLLFGLVGVLPLPTDGSVVYAQKKDKDDKKNPTPPPVVRDKGKQEKPKQPPPKRDKKPG
jgi:hypothetical protein